MFFGLFARNKHVPTALLQNEAINILNGAFIRKLSISIAPSSALLKRAPIILAVVHQMFAGTELFAYWKLFTDTLNNILL